MHFWKQLSNWLSKNGKGKPENTIWNMITYHRENTCWKPIRDAITVEQNWKSIYNDVVDVVMEEMRSTTPIHQLSERMKVDL
ncbi:MAG: hypothetical protein IPM92_16810 [Saprospiraceae bacterium]|nr:hypothetical protein [Saprospiraceae bacterium]